MTRKHYRKHKKGGGWFPDSWSKSLSSDSWSNLNPFSSKKESPPYTPPPAPYTPPPPAPAESSMPMGGKKRRFRRGKRGGSYFSNISHSNLAASAESWIGGKTRKRHRSRRNKSRRR
jgi:hypothetical protein